MRGQEESAKLPPQITPWEGLERFWRRRKNTIPTNESALDGGTGMADHRDRVRSDYGGVLSSGGRLRQHQQATGHQHSHTTGEERDRALAVGIPNGLRAGPMMAVLAGGRRCQRSCPVRTSSGRCTVAVVDPCMEAWAYCQDIQHHHQRGSQDRDKRRCRKGGWRWRSLIFQADLDAL